VSQGALAIKAPNCLEISAIMALNVSADVAHPNKKSAVHFGLVPKHARPMPIAQWPVAHLVTAVLRTSATAEKQRETCVKKIKNVKV
jgi:hypothetical protein